MSQRTRPRFCPQLEALEDRTVPSATVQRPIADFLSQQGTTSVFAPTTLPGYPDTIGWSTASTRLDGRFARVDYTGNEAAYLLDNQGIHLGTTVSGVVHER